jgi:hypothetical protein
LAGSALAASPNVVISQVYGGGGNSGSTYTHDFIELYNRGSDSYLLPVGQYNTPAPVEQVTSEPTPARSRHCPVYRWHQGNIC